MHDQTALKTDGIWDLFTQYPASNKSLGYHRVR